MVGWKKESRGKNNPNPAERWKRVKKGRTIQIPLKDGPKKFGQRTTIFPNGKILLEKSSLNSGLYDIFDK
jgi:hypothetical protein